MDKLPVKRLRRDKISFNNLPDEIIHKIFRILDRNSLKNCSLINKRCSEIIATSSILMRNFKLKLTSNVWTSKWKINEILNLQRHIQIIEISDCDGCHSVLTGICKNLGMNVRSLTLEKSQIDDFTLREMLRNADSLESLSLAEVTIVKKLPAVNPVSLRKLKSLTIYNCDWSILKFITAQISSLSVKSYLDEGLRLHLVNFMLQQYQLTELSLRGTSIRALFQRDDIIKDCNFSLESFHIEQDFGKHSDNVNWRVTAFMSLHIDSLKRVEIVGPHFDNVNSFAMSNLDSLHPISIDVRGLPSDIEFYEILEREQNFTLRELSLRGFFVHIEAIKKIMLRYPAIEKLELNEWGFGTIASHLVEFVALNFSNIKELTTSSVINPNVKFPNLKTLTLTSLRFPKKTIQFLQTNRTIKSFKVDLIYISQVSSNDFNFINILSSIETIEHLAFTGGRKATKMIFDQLKENPSTWLKTLSLTLLSEGKTFLNARKTLKFYFPIDKCTHFDVNK